MVIFFCNQSGIMMYDIGIEIDNRYQYNDSI